MAYTYKPSGVCADAIKLELDGDIISSVEFDGGCPGNTVGLARLVTGMKVADVISNLQGIKCGNKPTSCPDQLAKALASMTAGS